MEILQLKNVVGEQEKKLKKYEQKMRDLIEAYKALTKEKEVLESTVKSLINSNSSEKSEESEHMKSNNQVMTLSNAVATLTEEKRKMEQTFLEDRKVIRGEYESNIAALKTEMESHMIIIRQLNGELSDLKLEKNKSNDGVIINQVEQLMKEREKLIMQLNEIKEENVEKDNLTKRLNDDANYFRLLRNDLEQEMVVMKNGYESRVSFLEEVIADLSKNIGQMEQQHQTDEDVINKLSDKIKHFHSSSEEHRERLTMKDNQCDTPDILQFQDSDKVLINFNVNNIVEKMSQLRLQLQKLDPNFDLRAILSEESHHEYRNQSLSKHSVDCTGNCQSEIIKLKEELECSQITMQNFMKMNSTVFSGSSYQQKEIDQLNSELAITKSKLSKLQDDLSNLDTTSSKNIKNLKDGIMKTEWEHKQDIARLKQEHNQIVLDLQSELTKHRNRTINLLSEKDNEIKTLQKLVKINKSNDQNVPEQINSDDEHDSDLSNMHNIISCPLYQCCEMKARMEQELKKLRHNKRELIIQIHKLESELEYVKSDWKSEVNILTVQLQRAESINKLGTNVNMEYLRNVLIRFLNTSDPSCRYLMAKAIGKVLQFSSEELSSLQKNTWK